jgi:hypothetical protein
MNLTVTAEVIERQISVVTKADDFHICAPVAAPQAA